MLKDLSLIARHPKIVLRKINFLYYQMGSNKNPIQVLEEDWDNLIILDACRFDLFNKFSSLDGELSKVKSSGSGTVEFLQKTFDHKELHDTVYVTANPQLYRFSDEIDVEFHDQIDVWKDAGWDSELGTVRPETMADYCISASEKYPHKRLIFHFIQPHHPFIGSDTKFDKEAPASSAETNRLSFWMKLFVGSLEMDPEIVWNAYKSCLLHTIPAIEGLLEGINGKSVVTSDHGNMFGERSFPLPIREWGHPLGIHTSELINVPWLECPFNERRKITQDPPQKTYKSIDDSDVEDRLAHLGYV